FISVVCIIGLNAPATRATGASDLLVGARGARWGRAAVCRFATGDERNQGDQSQAKQFFHKCCAEFVLPVDWSFLHPQEAFPTLRFSLSGFSFRTHRPVSIP